MDRNERCHFEQFEGWERVDSNSGRGQSAKQVITVPDPREHVRHHQHEMSVGDEAQHKQEEPGDSQTSLPAWFQSLLNLRLEIRQLMRQLNQLSMDASVSRNDAKLVAKQAYGVIHQISRDVDQMDKARKQLYRTKPEQFLSELATKLATAYRRLVRHIHFLVGLATRSESSYLPAAGNTDPSIRRSRPDTPLAGLHRDVPPLLASLEPCWKLAVFMALERRIIHRSELPGFSLPERAHPPRKLLAQQKPATGASGSRTRPYRGEDKQHRPQGQARPKPEWNERFALPENKTKRQQREERLRMKLDGPYTELGPQQESRVPRTKVHNQRSSGPKAVQPTVAATFRDHQQYLLQHGRQAKVTQTRAKSQHRDVEEQGQGHHHVQRYLPSSMGRSFRPATPPPPSDRDNLDESAIGGDMAEAIASGIARALGPLLQRLSPAPNDAADIQPRSPSLIKQPAAVDESDRADGCVSGPVPVDTQTDQQPAIRDETVADDAVTRPEHAPLQEAAASGGAMEQTHDAEVQTLWSTNQEAESEPPKVPIEASQLEEMQRQEDEIYRRWFAQERPVHHETGQENGTSKINSENIRHQARVQGRGDRPSNAMVLGAPDSLIRQVYNYKDRYRRHVQNTLLSNPSLPNTWDVMQQLADHLLDQVLGQVALELIETADESANRILDEEQLSDLLCL